MHAIENIQTIAGKSIKPISQKHNQVIDKLELMLEKGIPDHTMSELAAKLKVSLRTLYEIAPSKDHLIRLTVNRILIRLGKEAIATITD
jgi:AcrR family transcriptional regulator